ncbi:MAG: hypothetical protein ABFC77_03575 [Thermoguttaceae bacterium]
MSFFAALWAVSADQIIQIVVILLVLVVPVIAQLMAKIQKIPPPSQRPNPPPPRPTELTQEVEQFLRRARQKSAGPTSSPSSTIVRKSPTPAAEPARAESFRSSPESASTPKPVGGQVGQHVEQYLDEPKKFERREASLGEEVTQVDRQIDQHFRQVFDHRISQLAAVPGESAAPSATESSERAVAVVETSSLPAAELLDWLGDPDFLRRAIVLNEILHRPEERWA